MKIVTTEQMQALDARTTRAGGIPGRELIERAGTAAARWIAARFGPKDHPILVVAGKGNNGADALVVARRLRSWKYRVQVVRGWERHALEKIRTAVQAAPRKMLVVDGLFGTGLNRPLRGPFFSIVSFLEQSGSRLVALDVPSGMDANTGFPFGVSVVAEHTLTFGLPKIGLVQEHAADRVGQLHVLDIGFPRQFVEEIRTPYDMLTAEDLRGFFVLRKRSAYKGNQGHVLVIGGSIGFVGAPVLAAWGALWAGAGLVTMVVPEPIYPLAASLAGAEIMVHPGRVRKCGWMGRSSWPAMEPLLADCSAVVIGPGLGTHPETRLVLKKVLRRSVVPVVIDAGGLSLVASDPSLLDGVSSEVVITPHPGEMGRLAGISSQEVQKRRFEIAGTFARRHGVTVVLKGARTLIAHPRSLRFSVNALAGNPGMASAGVGDVLGGVVGALLARKLRVADAVRAGVFLHAYSGDLACRGRAHLVAGDLVKALPSAVLAIGRAEEDLHLG